jgi:hypothetical protein
MGKERKLEGKGQRTRRRGVARSVVVELGGVGAVYRWIGGVFRLDPGGDGLLVGDGGGRRCCCPVLVGSVAMNAV